MNRRSFFAQLAGAVGVAAAAPAIAKELVATDDHMRRAAGTVPQRRLHLVKFYSGMDPIGNPLFLQASAWRHGDPVDIGTFTSMTSRFSVRFHLAALPGGSICVLRKVPLTIACDTAHVLVDQVISNAPEYDLPHGYLRGSVSHEEWMRDLSE